MEDLLEGSLAQLMRTPVQPAEIAKRLERAMELGQRASVGKVLVPTRYTVLLHPEDFAALAPARGALEREMARFIVERVQERGFSLITRPRIRLRAEPELRQRRVRVEAELSDDEEEEETSDLEWTPPYATPIAGAVLPSAGLRFRDVAGHICLVPLDQPQTNLGRARDNDVILDDPHISRYHARIILRYGQFIVQDLGSSYGTMVNGHPVEECVLRPGDRLVLGGMELYYEET
jgi:hypothetical protein